MVLNVGLTEPEAQALGGARVTLSAPPDLEKLPLGVLALDDVEAVISSAGITAAFQLELEEIRAIKNGSNRFLLHFHMDPIQGVSPFRFIFERYQNTNDNGTDPSKENHPQSGLSDPTEQQETD